MDCQEPLVERDVGIFEDRADSDGELLAARVAVPYTLADAGLRAFTGL